MILLETIINGRRFHLYLFTINQQIHTNENVLISKINNVTIETIFRMIKTSLDMKYEVIVADQLSSYEDLDKLHRFHFKFNPKNFLYLNISIKNKISVFFSDKKPINNFKNLEENNKVLNFFSE